MAFRFALDETPQAGLRRIACEQVRKILARLAAGDKHETAIHDSRKALKRLKALFKLVRGGLPKQTYLREYGVIRDVARSLSGHRDFEVMPLTLDALCALAPTIEKTGIEQVQRAIARARATTAPETSRADIFAGAVNDLEAAQARYAKLRLRENTFGILQQGAARGLRKLHRQHDVAVSSGEDEAYHEWRKSAQLHWRHLRLLCEVWPELLNARISATKSLAEILGHDHDLSVLARFLETIPAGQLKSAHLKQIVKAIQSRQMTLRKEARAYAKLLVTDNPDQFAAKLSAYRHARLELSGLRAPFCDVDTAARRN